MKRFLIDKPDGSFDIIEGTSFWTDYGCLIINNGDKTIRIYAAGRWLMVEVVVEDN